MRFTEKYMCCRPTASYVLMALIRLRIPLPHQLRTTYLGVSAACLHDDLDNTNGRQNDLVSVERVVDPRALHEALGSTPRVYGTKPLRLQPSKALFRRMGS
ncbi:hypothetical protein CC2G_006743 [Coprinopsis cinerea AmutBmut pab1-1]|nr:hypothetical protein CC2G_006743 [Coprinopsis cinerea AmutBmut pab1-1]